MIFELFQCDIWRRVVYENLALDFCRIMEYTLQLQNSFIWLVVHLKPLITIEGFHCTQYYIIIMVDAFKVRLNIKRFPSLHLNYIDLYIFISSFF